MKLLKETKPKFNFKNIVFPAVTVVIICFSAIAFFWSIHFFYKALNSSFFIKPTSEEIKLNSFNISGFKQIAPRIGVNPQELK